MVPVDVFSHVDGVSHCSCVMALVYIPHVHGFTQLLMDAGQGFEAKNVACMMNGKPAWDENAVQINLGTYHVYMSLYMCGKQSKWCLSGTHDVNCHRWQI